MCLLIWRPGKIKALLGPNGAGKSTLLGLCSSRIAPSEGSVEFGGVSLKKCQSKFRSSLGLVSHQVMLYGSLTGLENLRFFHPFQVVPLTWKQSMLSLNESA